MKSKTPQIALRLATADDALCLGVLATQVFLDTYAYAGISADVAHEVRTAFSTEAFSEMLTRQQGFITVAVFEDALVGFAQTTIGTPPPLLLGDERTSAPAELDRLYVQEPFTRQGLGTLLLQDHEARAAQRGAGVLWLTPWVGNHRALLFYARWGYADHGLVYFRMGQARVENRVLAKDLPPAGVSRAGG